MSHITDPKFPEIKGLTRYESDWELNWKDLPQQNVLPPDPCPKMKLYRVDYTGDKHVYEFRLADYTVTVTDNGDGFININDCTLEPTNGISHPVSIHKSEMARFFDVNGLQNAISIFRANLPAELYGAKASLTTVSELNLISTREEPRFTWEGPNSKVGYTDYGVALCANFRTSDGVEVSIYDSGYEPYNAKNWIGDSHHNSSSEYLKLLDFPFPLAE